MAAAIQIAGVALCVVLALIAVRPEWRVPALIVGLLSIPGNVDNLVPQFPLDPHPELSNRTGPIVSAVDLLLAWCVALTWREGRRPEGWARRLTIVAMAVAAVAASTALFAMSRGVDTTSVVRGIVLFARIPALFFLLGALRGEHGDATRLTGAFVVGGIALIGNGLYTTFTTHVDRFTAATFGRNGFAIALILVTMVSAGLAFRHWPGLRGRGRLVVPLVAGAVAGACLFGASATGTRMAFLVLVGAAAAAVVLYPRRIRFPEVARILAVGAVTAGILAASVLWTVAGGRTVSVVTDPGNTIDVVTDPGSLPTESEVRSRGQFWELAIQMARSEPLTGVGPFQWSVRRYELDPTGPVIVVDAHNSYFQIAAEYGVITLGAYVILLGLALAVSAFSILRRSAREALGWAGLGVVVAAFAYPIAELTNSHFFNVRVGAVGWLLIAAAVALTERATAASRQPAADGT